METEGDLNPVSTNQATVATPFHSTERCFRRYETVIARIVQRFPSEVRFHCVKRAATTDAARLKDAMNSYRTENWASTIDRAKFVESVYRNVDIVVDGASVLIQPRQPQQIEVVETAGTSRCAGSVAYPSNAQIDTAIKAIETDVVKWPIELTELTPNQIQYIETAVSNCFNVALKRNGTTIILI